MKELLEKMKKSYEWILFTMVEDNESDLINIDVDASNNQTLEDIDETIIIMAKTARKRQLSKSKELKRVILESPYAGEHTGRNIKYARECVKDSLLRNESPIASHLLYTQEGILDDNITTERDLRINAGLAWASVADLQVFYCDYGFSTGMEKALKYAKENDISYEIRNLYI